METRREFHLCRQWINSLNLRRRYRCQCCWIISGPHSMTRLFWTLCRLGRLEIQVRGMRGELTGKVAAPRR